MNCIIGDLVEFDEKEKVIEKIEKRQNFLYRPLIANIDFIGILFAIKSPDFDFTNFQKMLLNANSQNIPVVLILSKIDLASQEELEDFFNKFKKIFKDVISIFPISTETRTGLSELKQYINKKSVVISGPSGAGKSTLINTLIGEEVLTTNDVSGKTGKGRHTTIESRFFMTAPHSYLIDTPGFSTLDFPKLENKKELEKFKNELIFDNVNFTVDKLQLEDINLKIEKGKKYAIVGKSGAGKSTFLNLLLGIHKPNQGEVSIDGENVRELNLSNTLLYMSQHEHIYRASVKENVTVFDSYSYDYIPDNANEVAIIKDILGRNTFPSITLIILSNFF